MGDLNVLDRLDIFLATGPGVAVIVVLWTVVLLAALFWLALPFAIYGIKKRLDLANGRLEEIVAALRERPHPVLPPAPHRETMMDEALRTSHARAAPRDWTAPALPDPAERG